MVLAAHKLDLDTPDNVLVAQTIAGSMPAFETIVQRYQDRIFSFSIRFLGNPNDAEEVVQETFLKAYRAIESFRGDAKFSTWLFQIAKNLCINHLKKNRISRSRLTSIEETQESEFRPTLQLEAKTPNQYENAVNAELREQLEMAITQLDEHYRTVLVLRDIEELDYAEIADIVGVPIGTVKSRIHRARTELQKILGPGL